MASRAKAATNATAKVASAKAATVRTATAKAATATARAATSKAATAAKATAAAKVVGRAAATRTTTAKAAPAARPATAAKDARATKTTAPEATAAKATAPDATVAKVAATVETSPVRPTPYKRPAAAAAAVVVAPVAEPLDGPVDVAVEAPAVVAAVAAEGRASRFLRRRPPSISRRPALYLAAALVSAMSVSTLTTNDPAAQATDTMSHSVSVAQELGIQATPAEANTDATALLGELAVSRSARDAEQAAAAQVQAEADRVAAEAAAAAAAEAARPKAVLPVDGARLTSGFGARWGTLHAGIDLAAPLQTPEYAAMDGVVLEAGPASGFGLAVYIQHENGDVTVYGHMDSILVEAGQVVRAGDTIALLGNRGQSTGPHLHFEVHVGGLGGEKIDPLPWLRERGVAI
jgi:murein DD-endopeptidase MepM/ murein hydrolase activator NlpD